MTFETETLLTLKEFKNLSRRVVFKKRAVWFLLAAAIIATYQLILYWVGVNAQLDFIGQSLNPIFSFCGILVLMTAFYVPRKEYKFSKMINMKVLYSFDEEKISYSFDGAGGYLAWEYINKFVQIDDFMVLYRSDMYPNRIIVRGLSVPQIAFIKSKIKIQDKSKLVRPIR